MRFFVAAWRWISRCQPRQADDARLELALGTGEWAAGLADQS